MNIAFQVFGAARALTSAMAPPSLVSKYPGHVPLNLFQQAFLFVGSGLAAAVMPRRADLVATFGEASAFPVVIDRIRQQMLQDETGRRILKERPRITSTSLDLNYLRALPPNTLGNVYYSWLQREKVSPDTRLAVRYVQDPELAYIIQRYRECHDFYHSLLGMPVFMEGEEYVKIFEFANTGIPMTGLASLAGYFRLSGKARKRMHEIYLPWALTNGYSCKQLLNVYWEEQLERDIDELREEIGVVLSPDLRALRAKQSRKRPKELSAKVEQA